MGKIIIAINIILFLISCGSPEYKYHVVGNVNTKNGVCNAEWYSDTIYFEGDTIFYRNSDSSEVRIYPPYDIYQINNN